MVETWIVDYFMFSEVLKQLVSLIETTPMCYRVLNY
jgi:hypothetical protein